ncbi:hypothetical protein BDF19DRAFT_449565 [Syncephalis fuscata]|nr:hypothetical protein BDF19DRAFT_449565 [Syncephalis fuscata]
MSTPVSNSITNENTTSNIRLTPKEFFLELEQRATQLADLPPNIEEGAIKALDHLMDFAEQYEDEWFENKESRAYVAYLILTSSAFYDENIRNSTCQLLFEAATELDEINTGKLPAKRVLLVNELLLVIIRSRHEVLEIDQFAEPFSLDMRIKKNQLFLISACLTMLRCGWQSIPRLLTVIINLIYEFCQLDRLDEEVLDAILINGLLDIVDSTCYDQNDEITNAAIYLLVAIHHLFIKRDRTRLGIISDNNILAELTRRPESSRTFGECFVFLLNREDNITMKLMCFEFLWSIFLSPPLSNYFYDNDRNVLVDILMQNIADLGDGTEKVRRLCLETLGVLVCYTNYRHRPHKLSQVRRLLRELLNTGNASNDFHVLARKVMNDCTEALAEASKQDDYICN